MNSLFIPKKITFSPKIKNSSIIKPFASGFHLTNIEGIFHLQPEQSKVSLLQELDSKLIGGQLQKVLFYPVLLIIHLEYVLSGTLSN
jgi:hypothetical protein